jgi:hypothetical protein
MAEHQKKEKLEVKTFSKSHSKFQLATLNLETVDNNGSKG